MNTSFRDIAAEKEIRYTTVRGQLYELMRKQSPCNLREFLSLAKQAGFDTVTTYRTLDLFRKHSLVEEYGVGSRRMIQLKEAAGDTHHHFLRCQNCKMAIPFHDETIEDQLAVLSAKNNFKNIESHYIEIVGTCPRCV